MGVTLGIDIGTSGTKTLAIDHTGRILASAAAEYPCEHPRPGWSEQIPDLWWAATVATIRDVLANLGASYGEDRYRISPLIQRAVFAARNIHD